MTRFHRKTPAEATEIHVNIIKMAFIKERVRDVNVKKIEEAFGVKQEDTETQTGRFHLSFLKYRPLQKLTHLISQ